MNYARTRRFQPVEAAWLAGLIDGEGTVTLTRKHRNENRQLAVTISSTETDLLRETLRITGVGKLSRKKTTCQQHRASHTYAVYNRQALDLIDQVYPYLIGYKKDRCRLILRDYLRLTPRNGKYIVTLKDERRRFIKAVLGAKPV